eukprot:1158733-Pelagomonas_calceolata.AAC.7
MNETLMKLVSSIKASSYSACGDPFSSIFLPCFHLSPIVCACPPGLYNSQAALCLRMNPHRGQTKESLRLRLESVRSLTSFTPSLVSSQALPVHRQHGAKHEGARWA